MSVSVNYVSDSFFQASATTEDEEGEEFSLAISDENGTMDHASGSGEVGGGGGGGGGTGVKSLNYWAVLLMLLCVVVVFGNVLVILSVSRYNEMLNGFA